jgi:hypothetical protein
MQRQTLVYSWQRGKSMAGLRTAGRKRAISDTALFWQLWSDSSVDILEISRQLKVSIPTVRKYAARLHLPPRPARMDEADDGDDGRDPTENEIWGPGGLTEQIRATWTSKQEHDARIRATAVS